MKNIITKSGALVAWFMGCAASLCAGEVTFVKWGPSRDFVSANIVSQRTAMGGRIPFDVGTPLTPLEGYQGGLFYGGIEALGAGGLNGGVQLANNDTFNGGGNDTLRFGRTAKDAQAGDKVTGVFFWKRKDFNVAGVASLESLVVSKLSYTGRVNGRASSAEARFVVCSMGRYMISEDVGLPATYTDAPRSVAVKDVAWHVYDPVSDLGAIGSRIAKPVFSNVDGVGLFLSAENAGAGALSLVFSSFEGEGGVSP